MIINEITLKLRKSNFLGGNVFQAAEFFQLREQAKPPMPACYVMPPVMQSVTAPPQGMDTPNIWQRENYPIIVALSALLDQNAQAAIANLSDIEAQLNANLYGWSANRSHGKMVPSGSRYLYTDQARYFHQFDYSVFTELSVECDGITAENQEAWEQLGGIKINNLDRITGVFALPSGLTASGMQLELNKKECPKPDPCDFTGDDDG